MKNNTGSNLCILGNIDPLECTKIFDCNLAVHRALNGNLKYCQQTTYTVYFCTV